MNAKYYDGTKLLSMMDINGHKPEIYLCTTNRTGGKTTYFGRLLINRFLKKQEQFMLIYRFKYELSEIAPAFFGNIGPLFFPGMEMTEKVRKKGTYVELFLDGETCGYATALGCADGIKKVSHVFSDVSTMMMDEFQSETNHYAATEVRDLMSIHTSVARGYGKQYRYLPIYMLSNTVSLLNPYYNALGISNRLKPDTKFLKGEGYVLEQGYVDTASLAQQESAFNKAFACGSNYLAYSAQNVYLNDNLAFIDKPVGRGIYEATIRFEGNDYPIRSYPELGIMYCGGRVDGSFTNKISVTTDDHNINYVLLNANREEISYYRYLFDRGSFRFQNLNCKAAVLALLSY